MSPPALRILPVGPCAVLVELPGLRQVLSLQAQLRAEPSPGQVDVVAAAKTVLVTATNSACAQRIARRIPSMDLSLEPERTSRTVAIDTVYDGADLAEVAQLTGMSEESVISRHSSAHWTAAFGGFAPGFAYLAGPPELTVPRRESPRTLVPAGAVALAGGYSAVYPRESPGGWQLIGRTETLMWDSSRENPALVTPGDEVRFRPVRPRLPVSRTQGSTSAPAPASESSGNDGGRESDNDGDNDGGGLLIVRAGLQSTFQDLGRPGFAALGVAESGALDRAAFRQANRLVGNPAGEAVIETLHGGLDLQAKSDQVLAVTGAHLSATIMDDNGGTRAAQLGAPFLLRAGQRLSLGSPERGLRSYTAVRGGFVAEPVMDSRSTDALSGLGPAPLLAGQLLAVGTPAPASVVGAPEILADVPAAADAAEIQFRVMRGPRDDWFSVDGFERLCAQSWLVTPQSSRIGVRLDGEPLVRRITGELPSEGTVRGALQVPPSGCPVLFLADHPVTGGYPVIGVVIPEDLDRAAQLPPGIRIRFHPVDVGVPTSAAVGS